LIILISIGEEYQVMKLLIMQFSPITHTKYSSQHPVLKHPQSVFLP
jgi:hypothetical protein